MKKAEAAEKIKGLKPTWRTSMIEVKKVYSYRGRYYTIVDFTYKGVRHEYRSDAGGDEWIDNMDTQERVAG